MRRRDRAGRGGVALRTLVSLALVGAGLGIVGWSASRGGSEADPGATSPNLFSTPLGWAVHGSRNSPRSGDEDYLTVGRRLADAGAPIEPTYADAAVGPLAEWLAGAS